jgi:hypothetical protein
MTRHRLAPAVAVAVATGAIAAPAAVARPADSGARNAAAPAGPDLRTPDAIDAAEGRRIVASTPVVIERTRTAPAGFDWTDAAIGSGGTLGVILLASGATIVVSRRRREHARDLSDVVPAS